MFGDLNPKTVLKVQNPKLETLNVKTRNNKLKIATLDKKILPVHCVHVFSL